MAGSKSLVEQYQAHPIHRGLLQLIPLGIGAGLDTAISVQVQKMREERLEALFRALAEGEQELTPEVVQSEDFLQAYFATTNASLRTKRREKIAWFGQLLLATTGANPGLNLADEHEEYLRILDDLSYREIGILAILAEFESANPKMEGDNDLQRATRFWDAFTHEVCGRFAIPPAELNGILTRLNRTGLYETFNGTFLSYQGDKGSLTPTYYRLATLIRLQGRAFVP